MKRKILFVSLFAFAFLLLPFSNASAQAPFPTVGQTFTYSITGNADWSAPLDVTIGFTATAALTVTAVGTGEFTLQQVVSGTPIWPTTTGTGEIAYWDLPGSSIDPAASNTAFGFTSTGDVSTDDSMVSSVSGDEYSFIWLNWTSGSDEAYAFVGLHTQAFFVAWPLPLLFLSDGFQTMWYWNTSYEPWTTTPTTTAWNEEPVSTALGLRNSYRSTETWTSTSAPLYASTTHDIWIDYDTGILLKLNDTTVIDNNGALDYVMTTLIDLVACSFMTAPLPILLILIIVAVIVIIVVIFLLWFLWLRKRK